jgi:type VI secretion system secreted protein VgrG
MANQAKVFLEAKVPGSTTFTLRHFKGVERLSSLFEYVLVMATPSREVNFSTLIGQSATASVKVGSLTRTFNGIIGHFIQEDTPFKPLEVQTVYRATLYPKLWLLTFSGQCRIFQNKTAVDIITSILSENKIPFLNQVTKAGMQPRDFCVQYNETDFNFISRLMEEEGIFYFFQQTQEKHTLVLADSAQAHVPCPNAATASFHDSVVHDQFMRQVSSCFISQSIVPQGDTLKSYNYLTPKTPLKATATGDPSAGGGTLTSYHQIYDKQTRGDELAKVKLQSIELPQKMVNGLSTVPFFLAGYKFHLDHHPRQDANIDYVLYEVIHEAYLKPEGKDEHLYKNTYYAFPATTPFRAAQTTPKPRIYGTQTAKVTGKPNEEIYTEEYGRIKVKFHWDPSEKEDDSTSCWIRVATLWSGQAWGTVFTPRVGQEVVVSFIDGDPDKPLVVGSVYNGDHKPPYLPDTPTKSTIKSQTSKKQGDATPGYNEFRFEDKRESEEIYIHAQKDFKIDIQNNQDITLVGGNRTITLQAQEEVQEERSGTTGNDSLTLKNGNKSLQIDTGNYSIKLDKGNITVTCMSGNIDFDVTGDISLKCSGAFSVNAGQAISLVAGTTLTATAEGDLSASAGGAATIEAGGAFVASAGGIASVKSGSTLTLTAGEGLNAAAGLALSLESGLNTSITSGAAIEATAAGTVAVTAPTIELVGLVTANGAPVA